MPVLLLTLPDDFSIALPVIAGLCVAAYFSGKIDGPGSATGGLLTLAMFMGVGWLGPLLIGLFFAFGSVASSWNYSEKAKLGLAQEKGGKRTWIHAVSNGGVAGLCGALMWLVPEYALGFGLGMGASMASALSDTFSSELGNVYGRRYVEVLTFRRGERGRDGVVSLEGTAFGALGAALMGLLWGLWTEDWKGAVLVGVCGLLGNLSDSVLGATVQRRGWVSNHGVNLLSTLLAGGLGFVAGLFVW